MTKKYPIISIDSHLYAVDKKAEIMEGDLIHSTLYGIGKIIKDYGGSDNNNRPLIAKFLNSETLQSYHRDGTWQRGKYEDVSAHTANKIIATTDKSLNLPLLPEIEEDFWENMPVRWIKWTKRKPHWNGSVWMQFNGKIKAED